MVDVGRVFELFLGVVEMGLVSGKFLYFEWGWGWRRDRRRGIVGGEGVREELVWII